MDPLDETDYAILDVLKENCRMSLRQIAKKSRIPPATVDRRIKNMENSGIIEGYSVRLNKEKLGKDTIAYVIIRTKPDADYTTMMKSMKKREEVEDINALASEFDILLKVRTRGMKKLDDFIFGFIKKFPDVAQTQTLIVFRGWERR